MLQSSGKRDGWSVDVYATQGWGWAAERLSYLVVDFWKSRLWFRCTIVDRVSAGSVEEQSVNVEDALEQSWLQNIAAPPYAVLQTRFSNNNGRTACLTATVTTPTFSFPRPSSSSSSVSPNTSSCSCMLYSASPTRVIAPKTDASDSQHFSPSPTLESVIACLPFFATMAARTSQEFMVEKRMYRLKEKMHGRNLSYFVTLSWWL